MRVELIDIHKYYGAVKANLGISLSVAAGSIHGILGENGAGKSTLMKILAGYSRKTSGTIRIDGHPVSCATPSRALALGVGMLYQDPLDFPLLTVLDNFMLGQVRGLKNPGPGMRQRFLELAAGFDFSLQPDAFGKTLTVGERQQLEILRLLALGVQTLILDEPTTGISSLQKAVLFQALKKLAAEGKSVILVSHKLEDVEALCDRVTVLRQGGLSGSAEQPFDTPELLEMMFGRAPAAPVKRSRRPAADSVLELHRAAAAGGRTGLHPCDTVVGRGEVVGLAGLEGSGQGVFLRLAAGLTPPRGGSVLLQGRKMNGRGYHDFQRRGVAFLPGSRLEEGLVGELSVCEHAALQMSGLWISWSRAARRAGAQIERFRIQGRPETPAASLSGGNQQRLLLSFLPDQPTLLLLENPTRGLDTASARWVWQYLLERCRTDTSLVFSSPELDEILDVADRVLVFFNGAVVMDVLTAETDMEAIGRAVAGKV